MSCPLVFEFSVGIGGFVIGLGQISFFFSLKYIVTSARIVSARPNCKRAQVLGLKDSRITIRGDEDQGPVYSEDAWTKSVR